jgi:hypothetical protein
MIILLWRCFGLVAREGLRIREEFVLKWLESYFENSRAWVAIYFMRIRI